MVLSGLDTIVQKMPSKLKGKRVGVLCHAPSITRDFRHIIEIFSGCRDFKLSAIFGPQHGLFGQTQDNMIEWEGMLHPFYNVPVYSLYGRYRKPSSEMLKDIDILVVDIQDAGARLYTYVWTLRLCMEACMEASIPVMVLDRPNPIGKLACDGPVLKKEFFTFVGGASIPLCHRMTMCEMAIWMREKEFAGLELDIVTMKGWHRQMLHSETGIPWVLPSPNLPTQNSAIVYPGTVLAEALNISEGRGTTIPFELFGAPFVNSDKLKKNLDSRKISGCSFRIHNFIPTFNKYAGEYCNGLQMHITDNARFHPVATALEIFDAIIETSPQGSLRFNPPPYEYEEMLIPFDILSGDSGMRKVLTERTSLKKEVERWHHEISEFLKEFRDFSAYPE